MSWQIYWSRTYQTKSDFFLAVANRTANPNTRKTQTFITETQSKGILILIFETHLWILYVNENIHLYCDIFESNPSPRQILTIWKKICKCLRSEETTPWGLDLKHRSQTPNVPASLWLCDPWNNFFFLEMFSLLRPFSPKPISYYITSITKKKLEVSSSLSLVLFVFTFFLFFSKISSLNLCFICENLKIPLFGKKLNNLLDLTIWRQ